MAFEPRFSITNAITAALTEIERTRGFLEAATLADEWVDAMHSRAFLLRKRIIRRTSRGRDWREAWSTLLGMVRAQNELVPFSTSRKGSRT